MWRGNDQRGIWAQSPYGAFMYFRPEEERVSTLMHPSDHKIASSSFLGHPVGIRSYRCDNCDLYVSYEQDPKTGERSIPYKEPKEKVFEEKLKVLPKFSEYQPTEEKKK